MSLPKVLSFHLILMLSAFTGAANGYYYSVWAKCIWSSHDLSDMVFIDNYIFNKDVYIQFNSTVGEYVGYTEHGVYNAKNWNNNPGQLQQERAQVEAYCKHNAEIDQSTITGKSVPPQVKLSSVTQAGGRHPAVLMCSAYDFYPQRIQISWMRDGKLVESTDVTSTEEMADGDWYYQIHSHLEYTPKSGEKISCVVEHAGLTKPLIVDWDPSLPDPERNKIAIGASGLVLGIILAAAGLIYYKKKSTGRILVPS